MKKIVLTFSIVSLFVHETKAQQGMERKVSISSSDYSAMKMKGELKSNVDYMITTDAHALPVSKVTKAQQKKLKSDRDGEGALMCSCVATIDTTFSVAEFTNGTAPDYRTDDGSTLAKTIPFNFCLYGTNYTQFFINSNGNVTLTAANSGFSATGFPFQGSVMLAPFWADVNTITATSGLVYYKITPTHVIVQWNQVGYYGMGANALLNTFQVIMTNGNDSILPSGNNVAFCYGDMQWTTGYGGTNGFGGTPATVGINKGDGVNFIQFGTFDQPGIAYDGGAGVNDGIDFLDNQSFYSDFCTGTNMAPVAAGLLNCDTARICGLGDTLYIRENFLSPEAGQTTNISINMNGMSNAVVVSNTSGNTASAVIRIIGTSANIGNNPITFVATDDGTPIGTTVITANVFVNSTGTSNMNPVISGLTGFCPGGLTELSVHPTTYDNYVWSTVSSDTSITVSSPGLCFVTSMLNGCSKSTTVNVFEHPNPTPMIAGYPYTCFGSAYTTTLYSDSLIYAHYSWSNQSTNDTVIVGNGTYKLTVTDSYGCIDSTTMSVVPSSVPVAVTVSGSTATANITHVTYQWIDCGHGDSLIVGATGQNYTPYVNGNFAVIVSNGFCNDTSDCVLLAAGIDEASNNQSVVIAPNPFTMQTSIAFSELQMHTSIKIMDVLGKEIKRMMVSGTKLVTIEKGEMRSGVYFIQIENGKSIINRKIVID